MSKTKQPAEAEVLEHEGAEELNARNDEAEAGTQALALSVYANPVMVFENPDSMEAFYAALERKVKAFVPDLSTVAGRKKIAALAYEVAQAKVFLDKAGKELNEEKRRDIETLDEVRRSMRDRFDALRDLAKQPLTDWDDAEKRRKETVQRDLVSLKEAGLVFNDDTAAELKERLAELQATPIDADHYREFATEAEGRRLQAIAAIEAGIERVELQELREAEMARQAAVLEEQRVELEKLRQAQAEREQRDAEKAAAEQRQRDEDARLAREKEAAELAAKAADEAAERAAEQRRIDEEEAQERIRQAELAAERRAREEAAAEAERLRVEAEERHAAELRRIQAEAEQRERDRIAALELERIEREAAQERQHEQERLAAAAETARQANKRHRAKIRDEVIEALVKNVPSLGGDQMLFAEDASTVAEIVDAIIAGKIAHTSIQF